jgi:uncharacterized membrane protein YcaP (DUF421 family)
MKKEDIRLGDLSRILFGEAPPIFLFEVFIRTLIIYVFLLFILRWLGKRMSGQLTIMELSVMLSLGAIVSASMQLPDHGVLEAFLLLLCALLFQRGISYLGVKSTAFEELTHGKSEMLLKNGVLQLEVMKRNRISRHQIFAQLRHNKIYNLGHIDRVYLEASGMYSIYKADKPKPGLSVLPPEDQSIQGMQSTIEDKQVCQNCGYTKLTNKEQKCGKCGYNKWIHPVE